MCVLCLSFKIPYDVKHESADTVIKLMNTFSMVRCMPEEKKDAMFDAMRERVNKETGDIILSYNTQFYLFQRT